MNAILSASQIHVKDKNKGGRTILYNHNCDISCNSNETTRYRRLSLRNNSSGKWESTLFTVDTAAKL